MIEKFEAIYIACVRANTTSAGESQGKKQRNLFWQIAFVMGWGMVIYIYRNKPLRYSRNTESLGVIKMATINIADLATELNTDARTTRKFLRSITPKDAQPGKGSRWSIEKRDVRSLRSQFTKFTAANEQAKLDRELAKSAKTPDAAAEALEELGFEDPTDEQLDDMQAILDDDSI